MKFRQYGYPDKNIYSSLYLNEFEIFNYNNSLVIEINEWCEDIFGEGNAVIYGNNRWFHNNRSWLFKNKKDAMLFKLRWIGEE